MKICVYAIAKNESKFIKQWYESVKEADYVCVLDTGSTDNTYDLLKELNIISNQIHYNNFRFDVARNDSMKLIPNDADVCVCVDIDEQFVPGWSKTLKEHWQENTTQARYRYRWSLNPDGSEGIVFMADKIHKNKLFKWINPVHEVLTQTSTFENNIIDIKTIQLNHLADTTKSRAFYLPLLELAVKENPLNDRNVHYLGREYMFYKKYDKAIETLKYHLSLPNSLWDLERSASLRYIANCYKHKNNKQKQEEYLLLSILEANNTRESYFELGIFYFEQQNYLQCAITLSEMLKIKNRELNYMSLPECWGSLPYDYLSICYYHLKEFKKAILTIDYAIKLNPNDKRLINNKEIFLKALNN